MFIFKKFLQGVMLLIISFYSCAESSLQQLLDNKNYNDFFVQAEIKAQKQDKEALFLLGKAYQFGLGTQLDLIKAMAFYNQASELGEPRAYNNIGTIYEQANNMPRAIKFYKKAYDHGLEKIAITNLARSCLQLMYTRYRGISYFDYENDDKSCTEYNEILYKKDSSKVNLNALSKAKLLAFIFNPTSDNEIRSEVLEWLDKAIAEGSVEAITNKGIYYQTIGDNEQATVLFKEAADKGQVLAILKMGEVLGSNNIEGILWYSKAASKGSREGADKINYFANQYSYWYKEHPKVTRNQFEKILNNLQKYIEYIRLNNLDPITELPFQEYDSKTAADVYSKLKQITDSIDLLNEYQLTLENNKPTYSTNNIVTMTRQLQSAGYADANVNWEITTFSGDKILAKGISSEEGLVDLRLTKPDNEKIINYLNQGGILRFGYKQFAWFLTNELEGNIINLKLHLELAMLVNMSKGHTPEAYIIIYE